MFRERIQDNYKRMTPGYRKLADHILQNTINVAFLTPDELARQAHVDPVTIVGFCRELGYAHYADLLREMKSHVHQQIVTTYHDIQSLETVEFLDQLQNNLIRHLQEFQAAQTTTLAQVCKMLKEAPYVWATGDYFSYDIAAVLARGLQTFEKSATVFHANATETATCLAQMQTGEVLFAVAIKHYDVGTGYTIKLARKKGLRTICLVVSSAETVAREAEIILTIPPPDPIAPLNLEIPLVIVGVILEALVAQDKDMVSQKFSELFTLYGQLREMWGQTPK